MKFKFGWINIIIGLFCLWGASTEQVGGWLVVLITAGTINVLHGIYDLNDVFKEETAA